MSTSYVSVKIEGGIDLISSFIKENYKANVKTVSKSLIFVEYNSVYPIEEIKNKTDKGFKVIDVRKINDVEFHGFEMINHFEIIQNSSNDSMKEKINELTEISNFMVETILPSKANLDGKDPFVYLAQKGYLINFIFFALAIMLLMLILDF